MNQLHVDQPTAETSTLVTRPSSQKYRPSIDGMRAIAILSVLLFHLNPHLLHGGFVGVDIFFVISGFLITTVIVHEDTHGKFNFASFYQRRIARLFPSMFLVIVLTFIASLFIYDPRIIADNGPHMAESVLSVANIFNVHEGGGYFGIGADVHPFLHFWSLSVEEQFYVFFPATLLLLRRFAPRYVALALTVLFVASFAACIVITRLDHDFAFYMLPTRAWEMTAGALLATGALSRLAGLPTPWRSVLSWSGLAMVLGSLVLIDAGNFPGFVAVLPICGTVALIAGSGLEEPDAVQRALAWAPLLFIGRISYSLYLWHLPIFCLVDYRLFASSPALRTTLKISFTVVATLATSYLVEFPLRRYFNRPGNQRAAYAFAVTMICCIVPVGVWMRVRDWPEPKTWMVKNGGLAFNRGGHHGNIVLMGDSQACALALTLRQIAVEDDMRFNSLCISGSVPLPGAQQQRWDDALAAVKLLHPDVLIFEEAWEHKLEEHPERLGQALNALQPFAKRIVLITQPPRLPENATRAAVRDGVRPPFFEDADQHTIREQGNRVVRASIRPSSVYVLDTEPFYLQPDGSIADIENDTTLFFDPMHLSYVGEQRLVPALRALISKGR